MEATRNSVLCLLTIAMFFTVLTEAARLPTPASVEDDEHSTRSCRLSDGRTILHGHQIDRDDPCENCLCLDGSMFCWWSQQHCSNTTTAVVTTEYTTTADLNNSSWSEETSSESAEVSSVANTTETVSPTPNTNCIVMGREYTQGSVLPRDTGTCLECVCGNEGRVTCSPKDCVRPNDDFHNSDPNNSLDMFDVDVF